MSDPRLRNRSKDAVFLSYHSVAEAGPTYLTVTPELFATQLEELSRRGLRGGGREELDAIAAGDAIPPTAFLTFDDGFLDNYETVLPLLRERGMRAFVFVLPPLVDAGAPLAWPELAEECAKHPDSMRSVTWEMLEEMKESGCFEVGSHTLTHSHLPRLGDEELRRELSESRSRISDRLGSCDTLAYPFGEWSPRVAAAAAECGYRYAFSLPTTHGQRAADPLSIPRINVDYRDSGSRLDAKLSRAGRLVYLSEAFKAPRRGIKGLRRALARG